MLGAFGGLNSTHPIPFRIGADLGNSVDLARSFDGTIDHMSYYTGTLTADEVRADYVGTYTACSGDADGNGIVDFSDVARVLASFGATCP